jgi:hypothetical protein
VSEKDKKVWCAINGCGEKMFCERKEKAKRILIAKTCKNLGVKIMGNFNMFGTRGVQSRDSNSPHLMTGQRSLTALITQPQ